MARQFGVGSIWKSKQRKRDHWEYIKTNILVQRVLKTMSNLIEVSQADNFVFFNIFIFNPYNYK